MLTQSLTPTPAPGGGSGRGHGRGADEPSGPGCRVASLGSQLVPSHTFVLSVGRSSFHSLFLKLACLDTSFAEDPNLWSIFSALNIGLGPFICWSRGMEKSSATSTPLHAPSYSSSICTISAAHIAVIVFIIC